MLKHADVLQRIAGDGNYVGVFAGFDGSNDIRMTQKIGGIMCCSLDRLHGRPSILHHKGKLFDASVVRGDAGVGAELHFHPCFDRYTKVLSMNSSYLSVVIKKIFRNIAFPALVLDVIFLISIYV